MVSIDQKTKINWRRLGKIKPIKLKKPPKWHHPSSQERESKKFNKKNHYSGPPLPNFRGGAAIP